MSHPAWLPALALLAGVVAGAFGPELGGLATRWVLGVIWLTGAAAFAGRRRLAFLLSIAAGFVCGGYLLSAAANDRALQAPIRRFFDEQAARVGSERVLTSPFIVDGILETDAIILPGGAGFRLRTTHVAQEGIAAPVSGSIRVTVAGSLLADRAGSWRAGRRIRAPMLLRRPTRYLNFRVPDQERWAARRGELLSGYVKSAALVDVLTPGSWPAETAVIVRDHVRRSVAHYVGPAASQAASIVTAILIGDRAGLSEQTQRRLQEAGTYHVLAISGGNIAIFAGLLLLLSRWARLPPVAATLATMAGLAGYAYVVGGGASVMRATLMALVYLAARLLDHRSGPANAVAATMAILLCASPLAIFDAGFALTFGATIGIVVGVPIAMRFVWRGEQRDVGTGAPRGSRILRRAWRSGAVAASALFAASLAAEAAILPLGAWLFARITFAGLLLNFLAIPLMTAVQLAGLAAVVTAAAAPALEPLARVSGLVARLAADWLIGSAALVDRAPWLSVRVVPPPIVTVLAYYAGWIAWLWARSPALGSAVFEPLRWVRRGGLALVGASAFWMVWGTGLAASAARSRLAATFLDAGQGDAALIRFPGQLSALVDAGGVLSSGDYDFGERVVAPALRGLRQPRIEWLILTHGDPDHIGGAQAILRDFGVHAVWEGIPVPRHDPLRALARDAASRGVAWEARRAGERIRLGDTRITIWHPPPPEWERQAVRNDDSLVIDLELGSVSILLTGDIGAAVERELGSRIGRAPFRILKVPHHGSRTSSSWAFLAAVRPDVAIISAGRGNRYGHPAPEVLERYRRIGAVVFRTDLDGAVNVETDGHRVWIETYNGRKMTFRAPAR